MRFFVLLLMVVLLPLRSLAGDVLATQMAHSVFAIEKVAAGAHNTGVKATFDHANAGIDTAQAVPDCHGQQVGSHGSDHGAGTASHSATSGSEHCSTCAACQACHTLALSPMEAGGIALFASPQARQTSSAAFTSADAALGQKPPIS